MNCMKKALVPIADGIEEIEAVCIIDTLRRAGAQVTVASVMSDLKITASRNTKLVADKLIQECIHETYDLIALPGGMPGANHLRDSKNLIELLKKQHNENRYLGAICASPAVVLHTHNLLNNYRATCYPDMIHQLKNSQAVTERVVVDRNIITSQGPGTALEFALQLVEILFGKTRQEELTRIMLVK